MRLLLDTCTFLWLNGDRARLPRRVLEALESPDNDLLLSAVSAWEIVVKSAAGRISLGTDASRWIPDRREQNGIASLPVTEEAAVQVAKLQPLHKDPFDRMIVCQAITEGLIVVTPDPLIHQYPVRVFW